MKQASALLWVLGVGLSALLCAQAAEAASGAADGTYTVTVTKVEVSKDGATFVAVFEGSQDINIAAANAGAVAGSLARDTTLDTGTYTTVRVTLGESLRVKGYINSGGSTLYTNGSTFGTAAGENNTSAADYQLSTFTIPVANRTQTFTGLSMIIQPGATRASKITFNTAGVIIAGPSLGPPSVEFSTS